MSQAVALATERLHQRRLTIDDADLMLAIWNDPMFIRYVGDRGIRTVEEAHAAMQEGVLKLYDSHGYGPFRVALKDDDTAIGICGLFHRDYLEEPDIGYGLLPEFCGKGYAYEASCAVIEHAQRDLGLKRLLAIISPDNDVSIGLIRKLGFEFERMYRVEGDDDEVCIYALAFVDQD